MVNFLSSKLLPAILLLLCWAMCILTGFFPASLMQAGPACVVLFALLVAAIVSGLFGYLGYLWLGIDNPEQKKAGATIITTVAAICSLIVPIATLVQ